MRERNNAIWTILAVRPDATDEYIGRMLTLANLPWEPGDVVWSRKHFEDRAPRFIAALAPVVAAMMDDSDSATAKRNVTAVLLSGDRVEFNAEDMTVDGRALKLWDSEASNANLVAVLPLRNIQGAWWPQAERSAE